jgi:hypothetical protein
MFIAIFLAHYTVKLEQAYSVQPGIASVYYVHQPETLHFREPTTPILVSAGFSVY